jgi:hypothetical protein
LIAHIETMDDDEIDLDPEIVVEEIDRLMGNVDGLVAGIVAHSDAFMEGEGPSMLDAVLDDIGGLRLASAHRALDGIRLMLGLETLH